MSEAMDNVVYDDGFMWDDDPDAPVDLAQIVGKGYNTFWHDRHLYCMLKGSKGSKKSKTVALRWMYLLTEYPQASLLVIRRYGNTLADSCFSDLVWAMNKLHIREYWRVNKSSLRIRNPDTNQEIHFRGLDDSYKIASIAVEDSYLCWVWFEEFSEITNEEDFLRVTMSIRGQLPPGYFKQFVCSFNPWSENLWFKSKFFDTPREDTFTLTTTFRDNEFLDDVDRQRYLDLYEQNPRMARIICDGDWGIAEGLVYENWKVEEFNLVNILSKQGVVSVFGLDFGFKVSYNAFVAMSIDIPEKKIYVWDEMYERGQTNLQLVKKIAAMGYDREVIWADSAAPLIIHELQEGIPEEVTCDDGTKTVVRWALPNIRGAVKGHDSVMSGIARLQCFQFIVLPKCVNFVHELNNYCYDKDKDGRPTDRPIKDFDHLMDASRYASSSILVSGKGRVCEIVGGSTPAPATGTKGKCRRVVSTI